MVAEFIENLTEFSEQNLLEPVLGRENEIRQIVEILCRAKRCHPIILGRSGVGRSAIAKGLTQYLSTTNLPYRLQGLSIKCINFDLLFSCTTPLIDTLNHILETIYDDQSRIVLVLDGLSSLLKTDENICRQVLEWVKRIFASYELRILLICDESFYDRFLKSDIYLLDHCVPVFIREPSLDQAIEMVKSHVQKLQSLYQIQISADIVMDAVKWAQRYLSEKPLPTSALDLLDAAAASICTRQEVKVLDKKHVASVLSEWQGIDLNFLMKSEEEKINYFATELSREVCGQLQALQLIEQTIQSAWMQLLNEQAPLACFLFVGPPNVGKTTVAEQMSKALYGSSSHLLRFDLTHYSQATDVTKLLGSFDTMSEEGYLISELNRHPFSICLLEHIDNAHPNLILALQHMIAAGKTDHYDLSKHIIVMTTDLSESISTQEVIDDAKKESGLLQLILDDLPGAGTQVETAQVSLESILKRLEPILLQKFNAQFLQCVTIVPFSHLNYMDLSQLMKKQLNQLIQRLQRQEKIELQYSPHFPRELLDLLPQTTRTPMSVKQLFNKQVLPIVSQAILSYKLQNNATKQLMLFMDERNQIVCQSAEMLAEKTV